MSDGATNPNRAEDLPPLASDPPGVYYGVRLTWPSGFTRVDCAVEPTLEVARDLVAYYAEQHPEVRCVIVSRTVSPWTEVEIP